MARRSIYEEGGRGPGSGSRRSIHGEHRSLTRRFLIEAALEKFNEFGYHATRTEDIVGAAGASRSMFYLHFKGKIDVVHKLIVVVEPEAVFVRLADLESPSWEDLRDTVAGFVEFYVRHGRAMRAIEDAIAIDREAEAVYQPTISRFAEGLAKHMNYEGDEEHEDARLRATLLIIQLERVCFM